MSKYRFYKLKFAVCKFDYLDKSGHILFIQYPSYVQVKAYNLPNTEYKIHEFGDERNVYSSLGPIYSDLEVDTKHYKLDLTNLIGRSVVMYMNNKPISHGIIGYSANLNNPHHRI